MQLKIKEEKREIHCRKDCPVFSRKKILIMETGKAAAEVARK